MTRGLRDSFGGVAHAYDVRAEAMLDLCHCVALMHPPWGKSARWNRGRTRILPATGVYALYDHWNGAAQQSATWAHAYRRAARGECDWPVLPGAMTASG